MNKFLLSCLALCTTLGVFAQQIESPQSAYWYADGMRVDFTGATPVFDYANQTFTSSHPISIGGWSDDQGNPLFTFLRSHPPHNLPIIRKYVNNQAVGDAQFWTNPGPLDFSDDLGGEVNIVPFPGCSAAHPTKFLIIYNRAEVMSPITNHIEFVVYDYPSNTISTPRSLSVSVNSRDLMGSAVSRTRVDAQGQYRSLYFAAGNKIYKARIDFSVTNGWYVEQNPTAIFTVPGVTNQFVQELELNFEGDRLAWIIQQDNIVRVLDLNTMNLQTWMLGNPGFSYLNGLEWTPNGKMVFINRYVPSVPWLSGIAKYNVETQWKGFAFLHQQWSHSQIELAHDGHMYVTNGNDLLRLNVTYGTMSGIFTNPVSQSPFRTFKFGYTTLNNSYGAAGTGSGHDNYRFPDQIDGEVNYYTNGSGNFTLGGISQGSNVLCDGNDTFPIGSDVYQVELQLIANSNFSNPVQTVTLLGNQTFDLTDELNMMECGQAYHILYVWKPKCGINGPNTSHGAVTYEFTLMCGEPTVTISPCGFSTTQVTANNVPSGAVVKWFNEAGSLIASGTSSVWLADGKYSVSYTLGGCNIESDFKVICDPAISVGGPKMPGFREYIAEEAIEAELHVYPNPATEVVHISGLVNKVQAFDMAGREVSVAMQGDEVNVKNWNPGVYVFVLTDAQGEEVRKRVLISKE